MQKKIAVLQQDDHILIYKITSDNDEKRFLKAFFRVDVLGIINESDVHSYLCETINSYKEQVNILNRINEFFIGNERALPLLGNIFSINEVQNEIKFPWQKVTEKGKIILEEELKKELHEDHILYGKEINVIAHFFDSDDILCYLKNDFQIASVHLTWRKNKEFGPFPDTVLIQNEEKFHKIMFEDREAYPLN